jgi:hypothetical protein
MTGSLARGVRLAGASRSAPSVDGNDNHVDKAIQQRLLTSLLFHAGADQQSSKTVKIAKPAPSLHLPARCYGLPVRT